MKETILTAWVPPGHTLCWESTDGKTALRFPNFHHREVQVSIVVEGCGVPDTHRLDGAMQPYDIEGEVAKDE